LREVSNMSLKDLNLILNKESVITTWPTRSLETEPQRVERDYEVHARTHIPLGDTERYVKDVFKWVSGQNKGAVVGGVLGDYGEGKTSFLVHLWASSRDQGICAVPPFEWDNFGQIPQGIAAWLAYVLEPKHPTEARRVRALANAFRQQSVEQMARQQAEQTGGDYEAILTTLEYQARERRLRFGESADRLIDFVQGAAEVVQQSGYAGLLVLLDEPEVAAKGLGREQVQKFLFDVTNEVHRRHGHYGLMFSMPTNFYAAAAARFAAFTARLESQGCLVRLADLYGADFAEALWSRYMQAFALEARSQDMVNALALEALGQIGDTIQNSHLGYGPRSVVSAFRRIVQRYQESKPPYGPAYVVQDILDGEILAQEEYATRLRGCFRSPDITDENREAVEFLGAFPSGSRTEVLRRMGYVEPLRPLARADGLVYRTAHTMGLRTLRSGPGREPVNPLREIILGLDDAYAPDRKCFGAALEAFGEEMVPLLLEAQRGQQLEGWTWLQEPQPAGVDVLLGAAVGAFPGMGRLFPRRAAIACVAGIDANLRSVSAPPRLDPTSGPTRYDLFYMFQLHWNDTQPAIDAPARVTMEPSGSKPAMVRLVVDINQGRVSQEYLAEIVGADRMTPFWALYLMHEMARQQLGRQEEQEWEVLRKQLRLSLLATLLPANVWEALARATEERLKLASGSIPGSGAGALDQTATALLRYRYPSYVTLIRQPRWQSKIDDYIAALNHVAVPLAAKRGRKAWEPESIGVAAQVLGTSRMNLESAFAGYEHLIEVTSRGKRVPVLVQFKVHPMEEEIRERIMEGAEGHIKRDGKECPYLPEADLLGDLLQHGYTVEELQRIIQMGRARGLFVEDEYRGERILYCPPLDLEDLREQLRQKLADLVAEIKAFRQIPEYKTYFDPEAVERDIAAMEDEVAYEEIRERILAEFRRDHARLEPWFTQLSEALDTPRRRCRQTMDQLLNSADAKRVSRSQGESAWVGTLNRYIVPNLKQALAEFGGDAKALLRTIDQAKRKYQHRSDRAPLESIGVLVEGRSTLEDAKTSSADLCQKARDLAGMLSDHREWVALLRKSDGLAKELTDLALAKAHKAKGEELTARFEEVCARIEEHLRSRNLQGLPHHKQFAAEFDEIETDLREYLGQLKERFDLRKNQVNGLLASFSIDARIRQVFNPMDVDGCYSALYEGAASELADRVVCGSLGELEEEQRELDFAASVLEVIPDDEDKRLRSAMDAAAEAMRAFDGKLTAEWVQAAVDDEAGNAAGAMQAAYEAALAASGDARKVILQATKPTPPPEKRARDVLEHLSANGEADLKEFILQAIAAGDGPAEALERTLATLVELFKRNCIQVRLRGR